MEALEFTEVRKNQQGLWLNKDHWFKHTWLAPTFSEPAWLACVCTPLKITISIYLYQRRREKKSFMQNVVTFAQILQIQRKLSSALTRSHSSGVDNSSDVVIFWRVSSSGCPYDFCSTHHWCKSHIPSTQWGDTALRSSSSSFSTSWRTFFGALFQASKFGDWILKKNMWK